MKTLISTTAAAAIAMTSLTAAPAKALTDEEALLLFGIAAVAILAHASSSPAPTPTPAPAPVTFSTGPILLKQTYTANLDNGTVGTPGRDLWFQAVDPTHRYLKPVNGAQMAVGDRSNRGFAGCSIASYSSARVNINALPVGSYVCMKTNAGRISQFRVNAVQGGAVKKMKLGYTTWQ
jgi:type II secretory pathway pseudopilin PulG